MLCFTGEKKDSLFLMLANEAYVKKACQTYNVVIWHALLGHAGYQILQQFFSKKIGR